MSDKNIYQRINSVMKEVQYIRKDAKVQGYMAVTHDNVTAVLREHLVREGIVVQVQQVDGEMLIFRDAEKGVNMHLYSGTYDVNFVNMDNPEDRSTITLSAHAADNGDKAPGKCVSYVTKNAMLKQFSLETGENDESRTGETIHYTDHQKEQFDELLASDSFTEFVVFTQAVGPEIMMALNNSFVKGTISQGKAKCKQMEREGWDIIKNYGATLKLLIENEDPAVAEIIDELTVDEKRLVANQLTQTEIEYLKAI